MRVFGLFGEERTVLVKVDDFELIDYYNKKLNDQDVRPYREVKEQGSHIMGGIRRYSSHGTVDPKRAWNEDSSVVSDEDRAQLTAKDRTRCCVDSNYPG